MTHITRQLLDLARSGDSTALAQVLIGIPSVNPELESGGAGEREIARQCHEWLTGWGYESQLIEVHPGRWNILARVGTGPRAVLFNGHLDTVGVRGMSIPPFEPRIHEGRLYGRGSCDMKGGVAAILASAYLLSGHGRASPVEGEIIVALTADEEHASLGMEYLVKSGVHADCAVVCEPTSLAVMPAHKGFIWFELVFRGKAAHGSRPEEGIDAIRHAGRFLQTLDRYEARLADSDPHPLLGRSSLHTGTIEGGSAPSVYPDRCTLVLEVRTLPGEDPNKVEERLRNDLARLVTEIPGMDVELSRELTRPGTEVEIEDPVVRELLSACEGVGIHPRIEGMTAWVDAAFLNEAGVPTVCFGPGSIARAHSADEWIPVSEIGDCAAVLEIFARRSLEGGAEAS